MSRKPDQNDVRAIQADMRAIAVAKSRQQARASWGPILARRNGKHSSAAPTAKAAGETQAPPAGTWAKAIAKVSRHKG